MTDIDRRTLIVAGSAGLALAACNAKPEERGFTLEDKDELQKVLGSIWGGGDLHGHPVKATQPCPLETGRRFRPKHLCVQYLQFGPQNLKVLRGYIPYLGIDETNIAQKTSDVIDKLLSGTDTDLSPDTNGKKIHKEIEFLGFGTEQVLAVFVDNDPNYVKFDERNDDFLVRFTPFSGQDPAAVIKKNNAFFNLRSKAVKGKTAIFLDFWNTDENGKEIKADKDKAATWYRYSMNIHLLMAVSITEPKTWIPLIFDPDTGNMGGTP